MGDNSNKTLGYHRELCAMVFGEDSAATKFMDKTISADPAGPYGQVVIDESQLVYMLSVIHNKGSFE